MDEVSISTGFMQKILAGMIKRAIKKKIGCEINLSFNDPIQLVLDGDDFIKLHVNVNAEMYKSEFQRLIKDIT